MRDRLGYEIRRLPEGIANRIAAGEVIERPASVVKELVENAIDAGARQIDVAFRDGGRSLIRVSDDGEGMEKDELALAIERHATSKLLDDDLVDIRTLGFRGEALPSIGAVSRLIFASRARPAQEAWRIEVAGGRTSESFPASWIDGTIVEVRDLFFAVPARLKFLKSPRAETAEAADVVRRLALAVSHVGMSFASDERVLVDLSREAEGDDGRRRRIARVLGDEVFTNMVDFEGGRDAFRLWGLASLPTYHRAQAGLQFMFVNGRPVRDKLLAGAIRGAYADLLMRGRFPAVCLFIDCPNAFVDVNVHPAKAEVRFRRFRFGTWRDHFRHSRRARHQKPQDGGEPCVRHRERPSSAGAPPGSRAFETSLAGFAPQGFAEEQAGFGMDNLASASVVDMPVPADGSHPLGAARAQVHGNYIIAQTDDGIVIVDQHAAHERIVYEELKSERSDRRIATQPLLIPDVIDLDAVSIERLANASALLAELGLVLEPFGEGSIVVREVPAALAGGNIARLVRDVADDLGAEFDLDCRGTRQPDSLHHGLSQFGTGRAAAQARGNECAPAQDGEYAQFRPVQSRPPDLYRAEAQRLERLFGRG